VSRRAEPRPEKQNGRSRSGRSHDKRRRSYFFAGVEEDIELVVVVEFVAPAVALVSDGAVEFVAPAVALVSAGAVVVVVVLVSVAVVALVSAVAVLSAFFWQADRLTARTAAAATEVRIRSFMDCSPGGLSPDA
jgi:hypothetical protein